MRQLIFTVFLTGFCSILFAFDADLRIHPDKKIVALGASQEPMDIDDFIEAVLIASGVPDNTRPLYARKLQVLLASMRNALSKRSGGIDRTPMAENVLEWMHEQLLSRYVENQTRVDILLDNGRYNCVSSAVLYILLCRSLGIQTVGVLTADHAFARIFDNKEWIDVETTTKYGFNPGENKKAEEAFAGLTGFRYVPPRNYRERQDINEREMISLIYQNRIAELQRKNRWVETVGLARDRFELARNERTWKDYITSLNNYGADMGRKQKEKEALRMLFSIVEENEDATDELEKTAQLLFGNAVIRLIQKSAFQEAREIIGNPVLTALVSQDYVRKQEQQLGLMELQNSVRKKSFETAVKDINLALDKGIIGINRWEEFILYRYSLEAKKRSGNSSEWLKGYHFLISAPSSIRDITQFAKLEEDYRKNSVVFFHNRFVKEFRRKNYQIALDILKEAQTIFPEEAILKADMQKLAAQL